MGTSKRYMVDDIAIKYFMKIYFTKITFAEFLKQKNALTLACHYWPFDTLQLFILYIVYCILSYEQNIAFVDVSVINA